VEVGEMKHRVRPFLGLVLVVAMLGVGAALAPRPADAQTNGRSGSTAGYRPDVLIVGFEAGTNNNDRDDAEADQGSTPVQRLEALNVDVVRLPPGTNVREAAARFAQYDNVAFAEPDYLARADAFAPDDPRYPSQYGPQKLQAVEAHNVLYPAGYGPALTGGNPTTVTEPLIAVLDTGIAASAGDPYAHPDLVHKTLAVAADCTLGSTTVTQPCSTSAPYDDKGHGTHVAGIAAAETNNATGIVGIAPRAQLVSIKVLDSNGSGSYSWVASGVLCAANLGSCGLGSGHADVINMSLGGSSPSSLLESAIATARAAGVVVVASAGNSNTTSLSYPAAYVDLSVIATTATDTRASFSNYGGYANQVSAPGENILSTVSTSNQLSIFDPTGYKTLSGTSMASPHVAGLAALLTGRVAPADIPGRIKLTSDPLPNPGAPDTLRFGAGRVNAYRAITGALGPPPDFSLSSAPSSRSVVLGASTTYTITINRIGGFADSVGLSVTGLPAGATGSFSPAATTGGSSTLTVATTSGTPTGTFPLTITGSSGALTRTTPVSLVVSTAPKPDFSLSAPASKTVTRGSATSYATTITRVGGFTGSVGMSVTGLPAGATATFNPVATTGGSSTMTVRTTTSTPAGTYPLTITGTSGGLIRTVQVSLVVKLTSSSGCQGSC
jgi:subtilisin family serine protease